MKFVTDEKLFLQPIHNPPLIYMSGGNFLFLLFCKDY